MANGLWMGNTQVLGTQTGGHPKKMLKIKRHSVSKNASFCSLKVHLMLLFNDNSCYHLPNTVYGAGAKLVSNWEQNMLYTKS